VGRNQVNERDQSSTVVDSGYFTVLADVGVLGLAALLALFGRLAYLAREACRRGERTGWLALGIIAVITLDALTRDSFTGFPVPWVAFLVLGLAASTWASHRVPASRPALRPVVNG
jgi:O-antigen ligase